MFRSKDLKYKLKVSGNSKKLNFCYSISIILPFQDCQLQLLTIKVSVIVIVTKKQAIKIALLPISGKNQQPVFLFVFFHRTSLGFEDHWYMCWRNKGNQLCERILLPHSSGGQCLLWHTDRSQMPVLYWRLYSGVCPQQMQQCREHVFSVGTGNQNLERMRRKKGQLLPHWILLCTM